jgi:Rrf2 family protein
MIKLNRTTEYGLIALRHMNRKRECVSVDVPVEMTSAREIADFYGFPFEITAKTLQRLRDTGLILSIQGARGGYTLQRSLNEITLAEFLELMEGPRSIVSCAPRSRAADDSGQCEYEPRCEIRHLMNGLNSRVFRFLAGITLDEVVT